MRTTPTRFVILWVGFGVSVSGLPANDNAVSSADSSAVTIRRDEWGVAHIHGKTHADTVFGMGYAQAEDFFWQLEDTCLRSLGRYSEVAGDSGISSDLLNRSFEIVRRSLDDYQKLAPEHQQMAESFVAGVNRYLATHPDTKPRRLTKFEPWYMLTMDRHMLLEFIYRRAHVKRPQNRSSDEFAYVEKNSTADSLAQKSWERIDIPSAGFAAEVQTAIGSNAWAIAGSKTASGSAMLFINPHQPFYGIGQFYESHLSSDEGLNFSGASFFGSPFPSLGHNEYLGWTYTVNDPDIADVWRVTFDDAEHRLNYRFDGSTREATEWSEMLLVKQGSSLVERPFKFRKTHQGPIMAREHGKTYLAVQVVGLFDLNRIVQAWGMVTAKDFEQWKQALSHCAIPMFNVVYADRSGNIFYAYNGAIPVRDPEFDWSHPVDGSDPRTDWKGLHKFDELPQVFNPKSGYVQSCNSTPYTTTDSEGENPSRDKFPKYMLEDHDVDMRRAKMSRLLLNRTNQLTLDQLQTLAYDTSLYWPMTEIPKLKDDFARLQQKDPALAKDVAPYFTHLQEWDFKSSLDSTQTTLCLAWYEELYGFGYPAETLKKEYAADRLSWFRGLAIAAQRLKSYHGDWKFPWGKVHLLQRISDQPDVEHAAFLFSVRNPNFPLAGTPGPLGIIFTVYSTPEVPLLRPQRYSVVGASYMSVLEFTERVQGYSVIPFGANGNRESPHFFDQAALYANKQFKPAWFTREEVQKHTRATTMLNR